MPPMYMQKIEKRYQVNVLKCWVQSAYNDLQWPKNFGLGIFNHYRGLKIYVVRLGSSHLLLSSSEKAKKMLANMLTLEEISISQSSTFSLWSHEARWLWLRETRSLVSSQPHPSVKSFKNAIFFAHGQSFSSRPGITRKVTATGSVPFVLLVVRVCILTVTIAMNMVWRFTMRVIAVWNRR